jgi:hypothetical protein
VSATNGWCLTVSPRHSLSNRWMGVGAGAGGRGSRVGCHRLRLPPPAPTAQSTITSSCYNNIITLPILTRSRGIGAACTTHSLATPFRRFSFHHGLQGRAEAGTSLVATITALTPAPEGAHRLQPATRAGCSPLATNIQEYLAMQKAPPPFIWAVPEEKNILDCECSHHPLSTDPRLPSTY